MEIGRVARAYGELAAEAEGDERAWIEQARVVFLTVVGAGLRRGEILGLHWRHVKLADPEGPSLRIEETYVRNQADTPKSEKSERTIPLHPKLADELFQHRARTPFQGDDERVFASVTGAPIDPHRYGDTYRAVLALAGIEGYVRPFHDGRHTAITNAAASGVAPVALMALAGHSDFATTQGYVDMAGVSFRDEANRAGDRIFGPTEAEVEAEAA